jgi:signal transduction histidine kinase
MKEKPGMDKANRKLTPDQLLQENARLRGDLRTIAIRISHDLRTPLGGIVNTGELLKEILADQNPDCLPLVGSLFTSTDDLVKLIGQVRFIAKASADPKPKEPVDMGLVVLGVLAGLENRILKQNAEIITPGSWPKVNGVTDWIEFVWLNFLANALQYAGEKPRIRLSWKPEKDGFRFQVCDHGGGIPVEMRPKLFQPFDSLHEPGGTRGLGLSIVQRLMHLQGGTCGHVPAPEGGTCFYFTLPF